MAAALGLVLRVVTEMDQSIVALTRFHEDVATAAAISTTRAAARYELLPAKRNAAVTAIARLDPDSCFINKHSLVTSVTNARALRNRVIFYRKTKKGTEIFIVR